jgi:hypothetical protein
VVSLGSIGGGGLLGWFPWVVSLSGSLGQCRWRRWRLPWVALAWAVSARAVPLGGPGWRRVQWSLRGWMVWWGWQVQVLGYCLAYRVAYSLVYPLACRLAVPLYCPSATGSDLGGLSWPQFA